MEEPRRADPQGRIAWPIWLTTLAYALAVLASLFVGRDLGTALAAVLLGGVVALLLIWSFAVVMDVRRLVVQAYLATAVVVVLALVGLGHWHERVAAV